ncbi:rhomboid family intramembrane serine protease [Archangium violaceum]|uniref:Protease n=1 Tax=Archangium violaceum Cb vi76 TaxID=1406225 RepID=A0A084SR21_9BACT|nr:rhomboid family intramembrane serine protease [Archangium violaceum]KFA90906.1 protease [Archangium violaceum Cb vi76]
MIPLSDDNPTLRTPVVTYLLLAVIGATWVLVQGAGLNMLALVSSVCDLGLVPGELTGQAPPGFRVRLGPGLDCVVDNDPINRFTPITSMFLHGGWGHLVGNCLFFWVFGNNVEDSMGRLRFLVFYLVCGLAAAAAQVVVDPSSPIPMVGASGAISGIMGAYLILYPRVRVNMLFIFFIIFRIIPLPAWAVLLWWFGLQLLTGLPQLNRLQAEGGVAVWAHVGGFVAGVVLVKLFENHALTAQRSRWRHRLHPDHP